MGFGILFFGYLVSFVLSMAGYRYVFALIGYYLMFESFMRLKHYNAKFTYCIYWLLPLFVCSLYTAAGEIYATFATDSIALFSAPSVSIVSQFESAFVLAFHIFLGAAIYDIGKEVGVESARGRGRTLIVFVCVYFLAYIPLQVFYGSLGDYATYFNFGLYLMRFAWALIGAAAIFACYRGICDESDADMPTKPSRFAFINKLREENERRSAEANEKWRQEREEKLKRKNKRK